ncbi:MAG TPA: LLM class F420-dependent oxidoreductase [Acidimicrobiales bacterium]|jgi:F420-dependent oxidoreductase-like protein|nr:LLM class F420-dependent oxidoreductase [Acidimicrobiales bacterium]
MELRIFTEPQQGASYEQLLAVAATAEEEGYGAFFRSDHYLKMGSVSGLPGPTDAWITLAGLARDTSRIRLGTLLTAGTFRLPGPLAICVAEVDSMSDGRVELGLGAGWYEQEHAAYGIPFPALGERFERLEESLAIITGLWETPAGETFSFSGQHFQLSDSPALPKPRQSPRPPIVVGGHGRRRTPRLAARFADEFNLAFAPVEACEQQYRLVDEACEAAGRSGDSMLKSVALVVCCGADDAEVAHRAGQIGRQVGELRDNGLAGTPADVAEKLETYRRVGVSRVYLQILDLADLEHLRFIAREVQPLLAQA